MGYLALRPQSVWAYFTLKSQSKQIKNHVNKTNQKPYLIYVYIIYMFIPLMQQILKENSWQWLNLGKEPQQTETKVVKEIKGGKYNG